MTVNNCFMAVTSSVAIEQCSQSLHGWDFIVPGFLICIRLECLRNSNLMFMIAYCTPTNALTERLLPA
jgi:hypothetical protein